VIFAAMRLPIHISPQERRSSGKTNRDFTQSISA
jgi:hypothetical protein